MSFENMPDSTDMEISAQSTTVENTPDTSPIAPMAANEHICTDPDEHGPQGNGNGYGHDKGTNQATEALEEDWPSETPPYDIKVTSPRGITSKAYVNLDEGMSWIPESNNNHKHIKGDYTPPPQTQPFMPDTEPESEYGVLITVDLKPRRAGAPNDAYLTGITFETSEIGGTFYTGDGRIFVPQSEDDPTYEPITDNFGNIYTITIENDSKFTITIDSSSATIKPVDLAAIGGLCFVPDTKYSDEDFEINYSVHLENGRGITVDQDSTNPSIIMVDAVADLPEYVDGADLNVTVGPTAGGELAPSDTEYLNGIASQTISGGMDESGAPTAANLGNFQFNDYDGSEEHFVLIRCDESAPVQVHFEALGTTEYQAFTASTSTIWLDRDNQPVDAGTEGATAYYKILINETLLAENKGNINLNLPILVKGGTTNGEYSLDFMVGAAETVTEDDYYLTWNSEVDFGNNFAVTEIETVQVKVQSIESKVTISTGWAYESGAEAGNPEENQNANPDVTDGQTAFLGSAAFIDLKLELGPNEELGDYINLTFAPNIRGTIYLEDGTPRSSGMTDGKAIATIPRDDFKDGHLRLYFVPESDNDDVSDVSISYTFDIISNGADGQKTFTAKGEIPIVIDAVADPANVKEVAPTGNAPDTDGFVLKYEADIKADDAETQYIVIRNPGGIIDLGKFDALDTDHYLTRVDLSELKRYENDDPSIGHHFNDLDANDIILRIDDLKALDLLDTSADGTVNLKLPFEVLDRNTAGEKLNIQIDTVVVHGGGNNADEWNNPDADGNIADKEYDFGNNIAVTSKKVEVELSSGQMTIGEIDHVYESDRSQPHTNNVGTPEHGTPINLTFADPCEALREISFKLGTADDGVMAFGLGNSYTTIPTGGKVLFTAVEIGGVAHYKSVHIVNENGKEIWTHTFDTPVTLDKLHAENDYSGLRFIPTGDSDIDVKVEISTRVMDVRSGDVVTSKVPETITIVRDAVADMPTKVAASGTPEGGHPAFVASSGVTVKVSAIFGDYQDGSENHYIFVSKANLASVTAPEGFELLEGDAAKTVCEQVDGIGGIPGATANDYFILKVSAKYLQDHGGKLDNVPLSGKLHDGAATDGSATIEIKAVAVDRDGFQDKDNLDLGDGNREADKGNNVAVEEASATVTWATLENKFDITSEGPAYENDLPDQHTGDASDAGGAPIKIAPQDANEVIDTLTITYLGEDGNAAAGMVRLIVDGNTRDIPTGTTLHFTYDAQNPTLCTGVSYTGADNVVHSLSFTGRKLVELTEGKSAGDGLRYVPNASGNHSDVDVNITFSGTGRETQSGETADFPQQTVHVTVDAVADKPGGTKTDYAYGTDADGTQHTAIAEGSDVSFTVNTTFADFGEHDKKDDSEAHYLFINTKYLVDNTLTLKDANGALFTDYSPVNGTDLDALYSQTGLAKDDAYVVLKINPAYLQSTGGQVSLTIDGTLKDAQGLTAAGTQQKEPLTFDVKAVAVEHQGYDTNTGKDNPLDAPHGNEVRNDNNVAVTDIGVNFQWDALSGTFTLTTAPAFEGNQPNQNNGDFAAAKGGTLTITPDDPTEIFTSMTLDYSTAHGEMKLFAGGSSITLAPDAKVTFTYDVNNPTQIVRVECGGNTLDVLPNKTLAELTGEGLRYVPYTGDNDDADIDISITAETKETTTGTTGTIDISDPLKTTITVDAVADKPQDVEVSFKATGKNNTVIVNDKPDGNVFDLRLKAAFGNDSDGSEHHYFFISAEFISSVSGLPPQLSQLDEATAREIVSNAGLSGEYIVLQVDDSLTGTDGAVDISGHLTNKS